MLGGIVKPQAVAMDDNQLYVTQEASVFIYSLKSYKLIKKFGRHGQGPREFAILPYRPLEIDVSTDQIVVASLGKISYFSKNGDFVREIRTKSRAFTLRPLGDGFLGWAPTSSNGVAYAAVNTYDPELNKIREIYRVKDSFQGPGTGYHILPKAFVYRTHRDMILLPGDDDSSINVFNRKMEKLFTIRLKQKKRVVSQRFKDQMINHIKNSPETREVYPRIKPLIFPRYFPTIADFFTDQGIIYVMTWKKDSIGNEFFLYNLEGEFIKKMFIPIVYETALQPYPLLIQNKRLVQLIEPEGKEVWELHISDIN